MAEWIQIGKQRVRKLPRGLFIEMHGAYVLDAAEVIYPMLAAPWREHTDTEGVYILSGLNHSPPTESRRQRRR